MPSGQAGEVELMNFYKAKCNSCTCQGNPKNKHRLRGERIEKRPGEKDLWVRVDKKLNMPQPQALAHRNPPCAGLIAQHGQEGILPSTPLR